MNRRTRPSASLVIAVLALLVAITGTGVAAAVAVNSIGTPQLKANAVTSPKIARNTVKGSDVKESSLGKVPKARNADTVGGIPASVLLTTAGCQRGKLLGFVRVLGQGSIGSTFSTSGLDIPYNCAGGVVEVRRVGTGRHLVRFVGNPAAFAFTQVRFDGDSADEAACASVKQIAEGSDAGAFSVTTFDCSSDAVVNTDFTLLLP